MPHKYACHKHAQKKTEVVKTEKQQEKREQGEERETVSFLPTLSGYEFKPFISLL